jgi:hypothetical protein
MIDIDKAIFTRLTSDSAVAAIVTDRVYPGNATSDTKPYVTFETASQPSTALKKPTLKGFEITISAVANTRTQAKYLYSAVATALDQGGIWGGVKVRPANEIMPPVTTDFPEAPGQIETTVWEVEGTFQIYAYES